MKITITYKKFQQVSPDDFETITKVVHFDETDSLLFVYRKLTEDWKNKNADVQIHFDVSDSDDTRK